MKTTKKNIKHIQKIVHQLRSIENEKIFQLMNYIREEMIYLDNLSPSNPPNAIVNTEKFQAVREQLYRLIKRENDFVLPYIDKLLYKELNREKDVFVHYKNLAVPVQKLITDHHKTVELLENLKQASYDFSFVGDYNFEYTKVLSDLFDLYQLFEKHLYLEENILFPALAQIFEHSELVSEETSAYSHIAA